MDHRWWSMRSQRATCDILNQSKEEFTGNMKRIKNLISSFRPVDSVQCELSNVSFHAPAASDLFTGQTALLAQVKEAFRLTSKPIIRDSNVTAVSPQVLHPNVTPESKSTSDTSALEKPPEQRQQSSEDIKRKQKRFVLVGLGGSGKTEFCRKFAERNQSEFVPFS